MQQQPSLLDRLQAFSAERPEEDPSFWQLLSQARLLMPARTGPSFTAVQLCMWKLPMKATDMELEMLDAV